MPQTPLINGIAYSWSNIKFNLFGVPVVGIVAIEYDTTQKKENNYGQGNVPVSRGYGNKEFKASIEIYRDEWQRIIDASPNKDPLAIQPFDIQVLFGGTSVSAKQDTLRSCEFLNDPFTVKQGDTKISIKIDLIPALIEHN
jgi:hypothetical protein